MYCSDECQIAHWKMGHKQVCKQLGEERRQAIILEKAFVTMPSRLMVWNRTCRASSGAYQKPDNVAVDERFYVKVQGEGLHQPLVVYDKSRQCQFCVMPGQRGFNEIFAKVKAEKAADGKKTFVEASFDSEGNCTVYPGRTSIKPW